MGPFPSLGHKCVRKGSRVGHGIYGKVCVGLQARGNWRPRGLRGQRARCWEDYSPLGACPHRASRCSLQGPGRWAGALGGAAPYFVSSSPLCRLHPPLSLNVDLASPSLPSAGPYSGGSCRMLLTPGSPPGPCLWPIHSLRPWAAPPPSYQSVRLPPTHPAQTSSQSAPLLKAGESRA